MKFYNTPYSCDGTSFNKNSRFVSNGVVFEKVGDSFKYIFYKKGEIYIRTFNNIDYFEINHDGVCERLLDNGERISQEESDKIVNKKYFEQVVIGGKKSIIFNEQEIALKNQERVRFSSEKWLLISSKESISVYNESVQLELEIHVNDRKCIEEGNKYLFPDVDNKLIHYFNFEDDSINYEKIEYDFIKHDPHIFLYCGRLNNDDIYNIYGVVISKKEKGIQAQFKSKFVNSVFAKSNLLYATFKNDRKLKVYDRSFCKVGESLELPKSTDGVWSFSFLKDQNIANVSLSGKHGRSYILFWRDDEFLLGSPLNIEFEHCEEIMVTEQNGDVLITVKDGVNFGDLIRNVFSEFDEMVGSLCDRKSPKKYLDKSGDDFTGIFKVQLNSNSYSSEDLEKIKEIKSEINETVEYENITGTEKIPQIKIELI